MKTHSSPVFFQLFTVTSDSVMDLLSGIWTTLIGVQVASFLMNTGRVHKAIELGNECLKLLNASLQGKENDIAREIYKLIYSMMFKAYYFISDSQNASMYARKIFLKNRGLADPFETVGFTLAIARMSSRLNNFVDAKELYEKAINLTVQTGDCKEEADTCGEFGKLLLELSEYKKAKSYIERALTIRKEIGDKDGEAKAYGNLGVMFYYLGEYAKAKEYIEKALVIRTEIGDRSGEVADYTNLGNVFHSLGDVTRARECYEKALAIAINICDSDKEVCLYRCLGNMFFNLGEGNKVKEYYEKALAIRNVIGDRRGEAEDCEALGKVFQLLSEFTKTKEYLERALAIRREIGDRRGEAANYGNLGAVFQSLGEYANAKECYEKGLAIRVEIGDREGAAADHGNLGNLFQSLGEYIRAKEHIEKSLAIRTETGCRHGAADQYENLAVVSFELKDFVKTKEYLAKSLAINTEIGNRKGEAKAYGDHGGLFYTLGEYVKAREYREKALAIRINLGDREGEAREYNRLGFLCLRLEEYAAAEKHYEMALVIAKDIGVREIELDSLDGLAISILRQGNNIEALRYLYQRFETYENLRLSLRNDDHLKTSFLEVQGVNTYTFCSALLCENNNPREALYVVELGRARGLTDLQADRYSVQTNISANPKSWIGIENIVRKETDCVFLYISFADDDLFIWILKTSGEIHFKRTTVGEEILGTRLESNLSDFFAKSFRCLGMQSKWECEDRSLPLVIEPQHSSDELGSLTDLRLLEEDDEEVVSDFQSSLSMSSKLFIFHAADFLVEPEVIIVPHSSLYKVPFAALREKEGQFLSETRRIRVVPSLMTLKLIQDSPVDYHSRTDALIVGDPKVDWVMFKGYFQHIASLPCARKEAKMVGRLVGVKPLLGEQATKRAVLEKITSVSLIHFAAHGDAERGEIALSPIRTPDSPDITPQEDDYLLTMAEISQVKVRAKLVVLSCCHSGSGQIKAEGVIGIARAFLGSGARSVLVALWAISDTATEQLMQRFYEHLVGGESTSESLHQAMKWMRNNGYTKVCEWAPFMLIGDDVTFDFGNKGKFYLERVVGCINILD